MGKYYSSMEYKVGAIVSDRGFNKKEKAKRERRNLVGGYSVCRGETSSTETRFRKEERKSSASLVFSVLFYFSLSSTTTSPRCIASITGFKAITANA